MEYTVLSNVQIQQIPTDEFPDRNLLLVFSFLHSYEAESSWENLTQTLCLVLPKNVKIRGYRITGQPFSVVPNIKSEIIQLGNVTGENSNLGGFDRPPVFLRGDLMKFNVGYRAIVRGATTTYWTGEKGVPDLFKGFISGVTANFPFVLDCEDNMWLLKQMPTPVKNWQSWKLQDIVREVIKSSKDLPLITRYKGYVNPTVSDFNKEDINFNVQNLTTTFGSLASFLARLKSQYKVDSYFRGDELRIGYLHYDPKDTVKHTFTFQKNILDNNKLKWQRVDDVVMSVIVKSNYQVEDTGVTLDGVNKTKHASTEVLVFVRAGVFDKVVKEKGKDFPTKYLTQIGERYTLNVQAVITDVEQLFRMGKALLQKRYYNGFRGSFTTFAIPSVKHGDTVELINKKLPEQTGLYKVKAVRPYGNPDDGFKQEITIDYKI